MVTSNQSTSRSTSPIGIFDSGIGGLTVAKALIEQLPGESIIYYGDTAHFPYGEKSAEAIQNYSLKIIELFLEKKCKLILIACSSASAAAYDLITKKVGNRALVVNVIDPFIDFLQDHHLATRMGLIGTKQTVGSKTYQKKIAALAQGIELYPLATPLLAPAIEEGFIDHDIITAILREYLGQKELPEIEALILACTHYPLIKKQINEYYQGRVKVIDPAPIVAAEVKRLLEVNNLINRSGSNAKTFYVSYFTEVFATRSRIFFGDNIDLQLAPN